MVKAAVPLRALLWAAALGVALPTATQAQAQAGSQSEACAAGRISRIVINNGDVFNPGPNDPAILRWAYDTGNLLHVRTTRSFIRRELLLQEGDCLDPFLLSESRRLLDNYGFLRDVRIDTEEDGAGGTVVLVQSRDEWSTQVDVGVTYDNGLNLEKFQVTETNFLGNGVRAEVTHRNRLDDRSTAFGLSSPRFFGRADAFIQYGASRGGNSFSQGFSYPFIGETNRGSGREGYSRGTSFFSYAADDDQDYSHILVPILNDRFEVAAARRSGDPGRSNIVGIGVTRDLMSVNGLPEYVLAGDFDGSIPTQADLPAEIQRQLNSRAATRLTVHLGTRRYRYVEYQGLDAVRDVQTVGLGFFAGVSVGRSLNAFVPDSLFDADTYGRVHASYGLAVGQSLLNGGITVEAGYAASRWQDILADADFVGYGRASWLPNQTLFFRASTGGGWHTGVPFQLTLGGREGVRSLLDDEVPGGQRLIFVLEDRIRLDWPDWNAADLGVTVFGDAGRMWAGDAPFGTDSPWYGSVGLGLRLGFPRGTRNIWRPDVVFPVGPGDRSPIFRVTFEINRLRNGFFTSKVARSRRFNRGPEHF